jgi:hypothetical protein
MSIRKLASIDNPEMISALADVLIDCVDGGIGELYASNLARTC